jgi:outer membrane protein assembly factor BamA
MTRERRSAVVRLGARAAGAGLLAMLVTLVPLRPASGTPLAQSAGPPASPAPPAPEGALAGVIVHGNHTTPDAEILRLAGLVIGQPCPEALAGEVADRLRASGRFRSVEVRRRSASIADPDAVVLVILVEELAGVAIDVPEPGPMRRLRASTMWMPILDHEDGYGFTYGLRISLVDLAGRRTRISAPLTWGGDRRAALELERTFDRGIVTRLQGRVGVSRRENPAFELGDRRIQADVRAERALAPWIRVGAGARQADVRFGEQDDRLAAGDIDLAIDTSRDPGFPRNAVRATVGLERLWFARDRDTVRLRTEVGGYIGLAGQSVLALRGVHQWAAGPLPPFEQPLLGGAAVLRGFRAGHRAGDRLAAASAEVRIPLSSPLQAARAGLAVFVDTGTVHAAGSPLGRARFDTGVGAGFFASAPLFALRVDVARGLGGTTRGHVTLGVRF